MKKPYSFSVSKNLRAVSFGLFRLLGLVAFYACAGQIAQAQTETWGDVGTAWQTSTNWTPNGTPTAATLTEFNSTVNNQPTTGSTAAATGAVWVTTGVATNVTISGTSTLTIAGNLSAANGPDGLANTGILLDDSNNHNLTITPTVVLSNATNVTVNNSGILTMGTVNGASSTYTNSSGGEIAMTTVNTGTSTFTNSGTGTISIGTISGSNQIFNNNGAGVISVTTWTAGSISNQIDGSNSSSVFNLGSESGGATITDNSVGTVNITGTVAALTTAGLVINGGSTGVVNITGAGSVTSTKGIALNSGTLNLAVASAVTGPLTVDVGGGTSASVILGNNTAAAAINFGPALPATATTNAITGTLSASANLTSISSSVDMNTEGSSDLTLGGPNALGGAQNMTFNGGNYTNLDNATLTIGAGSNVTFSNGSFISLTRNNNAANVLTINGAGNLTINDVVSSSVGTQSVQYVLLYSGTGTLTLSNANTYAGTAGTKVSNGTLNVTNTTGSGTSAGTVTIGGIALSGTESTLGGTGIISGAVTTSSANGNVGHIAPGVNTSGNFSGTGTLTLGTAGLTLGAGTALDFDLSGSTSTGNDLIAMGGGSLTFGAITGSHITININATAPLLTGAGNPYTLISNGSGSSTGFNASFLTLGGITGNSTSDTATFLNTSNGLEVFFTAGVSESTNYYFTGATSNDFTLAGNYNDAITGGNTHAVALSSTSDVFLTATGATHTPATIGANNLTIDSLTFNSNAAGSSLNGTTGTLTLGSSGTALADTASGGTTETVNANVGVGASQTWSVTNSSNTLAVTGTISGPHALTLSGPGAFNFSNGGNSYSGGTTVNTAAKLFISNSTGTTALGTGTLTVQQGATFGGSGNASGLAAFNIGSGGTGTTALVVGSGGNDTTSSLTLKATGASTIANTNLTFNLNTAGGGNQLSVGATSLQFSSGDTLTLNLVGTNVIAANTPYILVAGTGGNGNGTLAGSQYAGGALGTSGTINGNVVLTGLSLTFTGSQPPAWYANSYIFLVNNGGQDDIEVEVVPEPGTWAMMIGGLAVLIFWQRRKSRQD